MDIKAYIESGILEQYVLGWLSEEERSQVEAIAQKYPEVRAELQEIAITVGHLGQAGSLNPDPSTKEGLMKRIRQDKLQMLETKYQEKIHRLQRTRTVITSLLALALIMAAWFGYRNLRLQRQLRTMVSDSQMTAAACDSVTSERDRFAKYFQFLQDKDTYAVPMKGTDLAPANALMVYYNPVTGQTLLSIGTLPQPPSDRSYQLWALVDGKPVDMGVLTIPADTTRPLEVPYIADAGAFAITLEPIGGSVNPTLDQMQALGALGSASD